MLNTHRSSISRNTNSLNFTASSTNKLGTLHRLMLMPKGSLLLREVCGGWQSECIQKSQTEKKKETEFPLRVNKVLLTSMQCWHRIENKITLLRTSRRMQHACSPREYKFLKSSSCCHGKNKANSCVVKYLKNLSWKLWLLFLIYLANTHEQSNIPQRESYTGCVT